MQIPKPSYFVTRTSVNGRTTYFVHTSKGMSSVYKLNGRWFSGTRYHHTLRDAIIFCAFGIA